MSTRRILAVTLAVLLVGLPAAASAAPQSVIGSISGSVDGKTLKGGNYVVRVRDVMSGQVIKSEALGAQGQFSFTGLPLGHQYLVELFDTTLSKVVGTIGAYTLSTATAVVVTGVVVSSAAAAAVVPAAMWLLAAGAGTASAVALSTQSGSR